MSGCWLEEALMELCKSKSLDLERDVISGLVSYCDLAHPTDAKEYLDNIIGQEAGKSVIEEYLLRRGHCTAPHIQTSNLHAYVKPPSHDDLFLKKPPRMPKEPTENRVPIPTTSTNVTPKPTSKKKKTGKVVSLAEAAKGSIIFNQGKPCVCQARSHKLVSNCLSCGKIVCEQEGEGPCTFCGALVLKEGSTYAGLEQTLPPLSDADAVAEAYAKRLVDYDRNSAARTTVIDDQSDYYEIEGNTWLSMEEKELLRKKRQEIDEAEQANKNKLVVTFDLVGRKVTLNEDEASKLESEKSIFRPPDVREANRIKPNPTLKVQPIFMDPGPSNKKGKQQNKGPRNGLCLAITGRVQHEGKEMKRVSGKQMEIATNGSDYLYAEDEGHCSMDYR